MNGKKVLKMSVEYLCGGNRAEPLNPDIRLILKVLNLPEIGMALI